MKKEKWDADRLINLLTNITLDNIKYMVPIVVGLIPGPGIPLSVLSGGIIGGLDQISKEKKEHEQQEQINNIVDTIGENQKCLDLFRMQLLNCLVQNQNTMIRINSRLDEMKSEIDSKLYMHEDRIGKIEDKLKKQTVHKLEADRLVLTFSPLDEEKKEIIRDALDNLFVINSKIIERFVEIYFGDDPHLSEGDDYNFIDDKSLILHFSDELNGPTKKNDDSIFQAFANKLSEYLTDKMCEIDKVIETCEAYEAD